MKNIFYIFTKAVLFSIVFSILHIGCELEGDINDLRKKPAKEELPAPGMPKVTAGDGSITVNWTAVENAIKYEVYISTTETPPDTPYDKEAYTTVALISGLTNKTIYYVWIKAVYKSDTSGFSPRGRGIPWPSNEVPAKPGRPVIIPGINQLTASWEETGGAASYEVYINTDSTPPSAPIETTYRTSYAIKGLENDTNYYLWIKAINNVGKSELSDPPAIGTPKIPTVAPAVPGKPVLTAGSREISASWQAVELAAEYEVWFGTTNNSGAAQKYGGDITDTEVVITGLTNETVYYVWIRAKNIVGRSGFSLSANEKPSAFLVLPETPQQPQVITGSKELKINWQPVEGALFYEVWLGTSNNSASAQKHGADVTGTNITLNNLENEITYYIWIKAKNNAGTSAFSQMASGTPTIFAVMPSTPIAAPNVIVGSGQLTVTWQAIAGASVYEIWTGTTINSQNAAKRGNDVTGLSAVITGLQNGTTYYIWIKAKNSVGTSGFSPMASGIPSVFSVAPADPAVPVIVIGNTQASLTWTATAGATSYEVYMGTANNSASASKYGNDISGSLTITVSELTNGTTYYFWLKAKNESGSSNFSPSVSAKPIANATAPTLTSGNNQLSATWSTIAGADQYEIFVGTGVNPPQTATQTISATTTTITGLTNGTTYNVWIQGKNTTGTGAVSSPANAKPIGNMGAVTVSAGASGQLVLNWTAVAGADEYEVFQNTTNTIPGSSSQTVTTNTVTRSGLTNGTTYYFWVRPKNVNGNGGVSASASGVPLAVPENLSVTSSSQQVELSWSAVTGAVSYEVYQSTTTTMPGSATQTVTTNTVTRSGLTNGTTYYLWVKAVNANGTSGASLVASAKPIGNMGAVTVTLGGSGQLVLNWTAVAGADEYEVFQSTTSTMPGSASQAVTTNTVTRSSLTNGTTYYFWVRAKNANGNSTSAVASGTPMAAPDGLTVTSANQQITLSWTAVPGASSYEIYRNTSNSLPVSATQTGVISANYEMTGLTNGTTYYFWIKAVSAIGTSGASPVVTAKPIGNMGAVTVTTGISGQLVLNWTAVAGADEYEVFQSTTSTMPGSATQTVSTNTVTRSGLIDGTTYYFWVRAKNANGNSTSVVASGVPIETPQAPTLTSGFKQLRVTWTAVQGALEYEVYYGTTNTPTTLATTTTGTSTVITGLTNGTTYYVRIRAKNSNYYSNYSSTVSETPNISPGLFRNNEKMGNQNLSASLSYISSNAVSGDEFIIVLGNDESIVPATLSYSNRTIGITIIGFGQERTVTLASNGSMFTVSAGVTLTLDENVTLVGKADNTSSIISVSQNGYLVMNEGTMICGNTNTNSNGGGVFNEGAFIMNGGTINGNKSWHGGGVYSGGTFIMNKGAISENTTTGSGTAGGGVYISAGTFEMNGGTISRNTTSGTSDGGGGVYNGGTFSMNGGAISGNTASYNGGGVLCTGIFTINGGIISGNTASYNGGGVYLQYAGRILKQGNQTGIIYGNDATGNDANGIQLKNTCSTNGGQAIQSSTLKRNTTAGQSDQINSETGQGLSATGNPPFGQ